MELLFTLEERIKIYKESLDDIICKRSYGICKAVSWNANFELKHRRHYPYIGQYRVPEQFPELWLKSPYPADHRGTWFPLNKRGRLKRIDLLTNLIKELES